MHKLSTLALGPALAALGLLAAIPALAAAPPKAAAVAPASVVKIENFTFSTNVLKVKAGTIVTWTNVDDIPHSVVANDMAFKSKVLDTGDSYSFKFAKPGKFGYFCGIHPHMVGTIIVTA